MKQSLIFLLVLFLTILSCRMPQSNNQIQHLDNLAIIISDSDDDALLFPYSYKEHKLPYSLKEISGLGFDNKKNELLAINDEKGIIYTINAKDGQVTASKKFEDDGDYEGIEVGKHYNWVVKSNGTLYRVSKKKYKIKKIKTGLSSKQDVEGLAFCTTENSLLLACKGQSLNQKQKKEKAIYTYDIENNKLLKKPFLSIQPSTLLRLLERWTENKMDKVLSERIQIFSPSGIAVQPQTKNIFVLSAKGSSLSIFDEHKQPKAVVFFKPGKLPQPEGLCFDTKGNLYICTEGQGGDSKLFSFTLTK